MIKYCVYDKSSELSSKIYDTREEAENDLKNDISHLWSLDDAEIIEVNE